MRIPEAFRDAAERGDALGIDLARQGRACVHLHPNRDAVVWVVEIGGDAASVVGGLLEGEGYGEPEKEGECLVWRKEPDERE